MNDDYELLMDLASNDKNYKAWRKEHTKIFGDIFALAFAENKEAQIQLTAALINVSKRNFDDAISKLNTLKEFSINDYDLAVMDYFNGLVHEMLGNLAEMNEHYERLRDSDASLVFPLAFHPYYRTAKFAQRESECAKSLFYYKRALAFYDGRIPSSDEKPQVSQIIYDIATLCLYMHQYNECERFLELSKKYDPSDHQHRTYVTSILLATQGKEYESRKLLSELNDFLRINCKATVDAILEARDPHYSIAVQDRSKYSDFWNYILSHKRKLLKLIREQRIDECRKIISEKLSISIPFVRRLLDCHIESSDGKITVYCKSYCVKTLESEYAALFDKKPPELENWEFISVRWFENY